MSNEKIAALGKILLGDPANWKKILLDHDWSKLVVTYNDLLELFQLIGKRVDNVCLHQIIKEKQGLLSSAEEVITIMEVCPQCTGFILFVCLKIELFTTETALMSFLRSKNNAALNKCVLFDHGKLDKIMQVSNILWVIKKNPTMLNLNEILFRYNKQILFKDEGAIVSLLEIFPPEVQEQILFAPYDGISLITNVSRIIQLVKILPQRAKEILFDYGKLNLFKDKQSRCYLLTSIASFPELQVLRDLIGHIFVPRSFTENMNFLQKYSEYISEFMRHSKDDFITDVDELCEFVEKFPMGMFLAIYDCRKIHLLASEADCEKLCSSVTKGDPVFATVTRIRASYQKIATKRAEIFVQMHPKKSVAEEKATASETPPNKKRKTSATTVATKSGEAFFQTGDDRVHEKSVAVVGEKSSGSELLESCSLLLKP